MAFESVLAKEIEKWLASQRAPRSNITTGAANPALKPGALANPALRMGGGEGGLTAERILGQQRQLEILQQPIETPAAQPGMIAPVDSSMLGALANTGRAIWAGNLQKKADRDSARLLAEELAGQQGQDDSADALQAIIPPSLRGIGPVPGPGAKDAQRAADAGVSSYLGANDVTRHDVAALSDPRVAPLVWNRLTAKPERIDAGDKILLVRGGKVVGSLPKGVSPDAAANLEASEARAKSQNEFTWQQGEATRAQQRELADQQRALTQRGQDFAQQRATVDDKRVQSQVDRENTEKDRTRTEKYQSALDAFGRGMTLIDRISHKDPETGRDVDHPGLSAAVGAKGASSLFGLLSSPIAGTDAADFKALADQLSGQLFLEAFDALRGGGAITEIEGQQAKAAIANLATSQSEEQFKENLSTLRGVMGSTLQRAQLRAGAVGPGATSTAPSYTEGGGSGGIPTFATEQEAAAAADAGMIKPGTRIKIGNTPGTWQ